MSQRAALCVRPVGLIPITVNGNVPVGTESSTKIVTVDALVPPAEVAIWFGPLSLNVAVTPDGPEYVNETVCENPFRDSTYRFSVPAAPCGMLIPVLDRATEKSPVATCAATLCSDREASVVRKTMASMEGSRRP